MTDSPLIRGWQLRRDSFKGNLAAHCREMAATATQLDSSNGRPLCDFAAHSESLSAWDQALTALEVLLRVVQPSEDFHPLPGGEFERTLAHLGSRGIFGAPASSLVIGELLVAAALDAETFVGRRVGAEREAHELTEAKLVKADRRILQMEGAESALMRLRSDNAEKDRLIEQLEKRVAYQNLTTDEQETEVTYESA